MREARLLRGSVNASRRPGIVLMLHIGRCGSTVLANMLSQHPDICWDGKIFRTAREVYRIDLNPSNVGPWTRRQFALSGSKYYGFEYKILPDQYSDDLGIELMQFLEVCRSIGVTHYLILKRANTLRQVVSNYASIARGQWHKEFGGKVDNKVFHLDLEHITTGNSQGQPLLSYLEEVDATHNAVDAFLKDENVLQISYESDIETAGPDTAFEKVCAFLGLSKVQVEVRNQKLNPKRIDELVENFDELKGTLTGTRYEWMLN